MASAEGYTTSYAYALPTQSPTRLDRRASTQTENRRVEEDDVVQGRIFWLPPKEELPERAVRRAHGKGAIEEGIYDHPIVVISRPADDPQVVHFHLITSFQGKRLHEIYGKNNEFHASRRSWYLPIAPTLDHPDATSKKSKKRFPTLDLAGGAALRWDSYVNLRHVYRIDWSLLRPYFNPDMPLNITFRFQRESMIRLLAKSKVLTTYETGTQWQRPTEEMPLQPRPSTIQTTGYEAYGARYEGYGAEKHPYYTPRSSISVPRSSSEYSSLYSPIQQSHFLGSRRDGYRNLEAPPKAPPDRDKDGRVLVFLRYGMQCLWDCLMAIVRWIWERLFR